MTCSVPAYGHSGWIWGHVNISAAVMTRWAVSEWRRLTGHQCAITVAGYSKR